MPTVTVLAAAERPVAARLDGGRVLLAADQLAAATGWELKDEGLCQDDVCVPVDERQRLVVDRHVDLVVLGELLGAPVVVDVEERIAALGQRPDDLGARLRSLDAPDVTLPDLAGTPTALSAFVGRKRLLVAFASW